MVMDDTLPAALATDLDGAFETLVRSHQDRLYTIALRLLGDPRDAEEVAQDAFVRAHRAIAEYPPERTRELRLRPWLATIVVNLCRNRGRRRPPAPGPAGRLPSPRPNGPGSFGSGRGWRPSSSTSAATGSAVGSRRSSRSTSRTAARPVAVPAHLSRDRPLPAPAPT